MVNISGGQLKIVVLIASLLFSAQLYSRSVTHKYDRYFKEASVFLPWPFNASKLLNSLCYQESRFNPLAESQVGAKGICQFMDSTWAEMKKKNPDIAGSVWVPQASIYIAGHYLGQSIRFWNANGRTTQSRGKLGTAGYNSGNGNILKAQKVCGGKMEYEEIVPPCLDKVTGKHSNETINYVDNIWNQWLPMFSEG